MHAGTKYLDGQGRVMAGALCGPRSLIHDVFGRRCATAGMTLAPFNAWVVLKGLETLSLRMRRKARRRWPWPNGWSDIRQCRGCTTPD